MCNLCRETGWLSPGKLHYGNLINLFEGAEECGCKPIEHLFYDNFDDLYNVEETSMSNRDPAMLESIYERIEGDRYPTPPWVTEAIIPHLWECQLHEDTPILEPACGEGRMAKILKKYFDNVISKDIHYQGYGDGIEDFLQRQESAQAIVSNPPYTIVEEFIRHSLKLTESNGGLVAMLLRNEYDSAKNRVDLFTRPPFCRKIVLTSRPRWIDGTTISPRHNYSWFLFSHKHIGPATLHYYIKPKDNIVDNEG